MSDMGNTARPTIESSTLTDCPGLVVLDIDGTLTDTIALHQAALLAAMQSFDFPDLDVNWHDYRHHTDSAIFAEAWERAGWQGPTEADRLLFSERFERSFEQLRPSNPIREIKGAAGFVTLLQTKGWLVAFATGGLRGPSRIKLREAGIPFLDAPLVTASEYLTRDEIVSAAIQAATSQGTALPKVTVSLGDGLWDLQTAETLGLHFLGIGAGTGARLLVERGARMLPDFSDPFGSLEIVSTLARR